MKNIVKSILSFVVIAALAVACSPKTESAVQSDAAAADSTEVSAPIDSVATPTDSASVN